MIRISRMCGTAVLWLLGTGLFASYPTRAASEPDTATPGCVERVLAADDALGRARNRAPETAPIDAAVQAYVDAVESLDYTGCPELFVAAFSAHVAAWRATLPMLKRHAEHRGEMHALFKAISADPEGQDLPAYEAVLRKTWDEVERAAKPEVR